METTLSSTQVTAFGCTGRSVRAASYTARGTCKMDFDVCASSWGCPDAGFGFGAVGVAQRHHVALRMLQIARGIELRNIAAANDGKTDLVHGASSEVGIWRVRLYLYFERTVTVTVAACGRKQDSRDTHQ